MSWRKAAELARQQAVDSRLAAAELKIDDVRVERFQAYLRKADQGALVAWIRNRRAQDLESFAGECERRQDTDVTVKEGRPKK